MQIALKIKFYFRVICETLVLISVFFCGLRYSSSVKFESPLLLKRSLLYLALYMCHSQILGKYSLQYDDQDTNLFWQKVGAEK